MHDFASYRDQLSTFLTAFLTTQSQLLADQSLAAEVFTLLKPYCVAGKMLRGGLLLGTYQALANQPVTSGQLAVAAAQELTESALLIHDDIIDQDEQRRGGVAIHTHFVEQATKCGYPQPQHYGESLGVCVGDVIFFSCYQLLAQADLSAPLKTSLISLFSRQLSRVALAEMADVQLAARSDQITKSEIVAVYLGKTSNYSFSLPLMAGAILAGKPRLVDQLDKLGQVLGLIYQLKDDELGLFGDPTQTGKPVGADVREGKKTLFYYYAQELVKGDDRVRLAELFGNPNLAAADMTWLRRVLKKSGVTKAVDSELIVLRQQAERLISNFGEPSLGAMLENLLQYQLFRQR